MKDTDAPDQDRATKEQRGSDDRSQEAFEEIHSKEARRRHHQAFEEDEGPDLGQAHYPPDERRGTHLQSHTARDVVPAHVIHEGRGLPAPRRIDPRGSGHRADKVEQDLRYRGKCHSRWGTLRVA